MISKAKLKLIRSLEQKKYRRQEGLFVAEGPKVVGDLLALTPAHELFATGEWLNRNKTACQHCPCTEVSEDELRKLSFLQHPQQVLATFPLPQTADAATATAICQAESSRSVVLALDGVQDPGNLGTIIRLADWFGIQTLCCSTDTVDAFNPKVVQATMGSLARVHIYYIDLVGLIDSLPPTVPVYGTLLNGDNIYTQQLAETGIIVMGNEGKGISAPVAARVDHKLLIPNYPTGRETTDSLNVAIATAITCAEFRRQHTQSSIFRTQ